MAFDLNAIDQEEIFTCGIVRSLSLEVLSTVFKYLDVRSKGRAARVCRTWRDVAYIPSVWKNVEVCRLSPASLVDVYLKRRIHRITTPDLFSNTTSIDEWLRQVDEFASHCSESSTPVTVSIKCCCTFNNFTPDSLVTLLRVTSAFLLTTIYLTECWCVTNSFFVLVAEKCPGLVNLTLRRNVRATNLDDTLDARTVWTALGKLRKLRSIGLLCWNIDDVFFRYLVESFVDESGDHAETGNTAKRCGRRNQLPLTVLKLSRCTEITDESLGYISQTMPDLVGLYLTCSNGITYEGMKYLSALPKLRKLTLPCLRPSAGGGKKLPSTTDDTGENYNDIGVASLAKSGVLGRLERLLVVGITDKSMNLLAPCTRRSAATTGRLVTLCLCRADVTCRGLNLLVDDSSSVSTLRLLNLFKCKNITSHAVGQLAKSDQLVNLTDLQLSSCSQLDDTALTHIADGFPSLRRLWIRHCSFTNSGIHRLVLGGKRLTFLDISHNRQLTASCLSQIARHLNNLESISICGKDYSEVVATKGFKSLLRLPRIREVQLTFKINYECWSRVVKRKMQYCWL